MNAYGNDYHDHWPLIAAAKSSPDIFEKLIQHGAYQGYIEGLHILVRNDSDTNFIKKTIVFTH